MASLTKFHIFLKEQGGNQNKKIVPPSEQYLYIAVNCIGLVERGRYDGGTMGEARDTNRIREQAHHCWQQLFNVGQMLQKKSTMLTREQCFQAIFRF